MVRTIKRLKSFVFPRIVDTDREMRVMRHFLITLGVACIMGFQVWRGVFNNFAVEVAGVGAYQMGLIQGLREVPGFLALLVIFLIMLVFEQRLAQISVAAMSLGIALTGFFPSFGGLLCTTLLMSFGFHYYETVNQSLGLQHVPPDRAPLFLGQLRSWSGLAGLIGLAAVLGLSLFMSYRGLLLTAGSAMLLIELWSAVRYPLVRERVPQRRKMILRRRYWLYYTLTFLSGARRQIFVAFAVFLLVERHGFSVREVTGLFFVNSLVTMFLAPLIGRLVQTAGERAVVRLENGGLILVFWGYTVAEQKWLLSSLYILDHVFFNMAIAIRTYFQKIADPADVAPSMAMGFTINHIAAVVIPVIGGLIWIVDFRLTFYFGMLLAAASLVFANFMRIPAERSAAEPAGATSSLQGSAGDRS